MKSMNGQQLKTIAITAMLLDHIAWAFLDFQSFWGQLFHIVGRITAPTMSFFIVQGYLHTRSFWKYLTRLLVFAVISHVPYVYFSYGTMHWFSFNVLYTLALGLLAVFCWDKISDLRLRTLAVIGLGILSLPGDWFYIIIIFCLIFFIYRGDFRSQAAAVTYTAVIIALVQFGGSLAAGDTISEALLSSGFHLGIILSLPLLKLYNGQRGGGRWSHWLFYIFYPAHLLVLSALKQGF